MKHIGNIQVSGSLQQSGSGDNIFLGNVSISGSTIYKGGSTKFGDSNEDVHEFTGSLHIKQGNTYTSTGSFVDFGITYESFKITASSSLELAVNDSSVFRSFYDTANASSILLLTADEVYDSGGGTISSTETLKENIIDIEYNVINGIDNLRPVSFNWKSNGKFDYGLIAEELDLVYPGIVRRLGDRIMGYSADAILSLLVKTVQDLRQRVAQLESGSV